MYEVIVTIISTGLLFEIFSSQFQYLIIFEVYFFYLNWPINVQSVEINIDYFTTAMDRLL